MLETSKEVADLFQDVPDDIADEEQRHMIMLGYTSSTFLVCAINPSELHIRFRQGLSSGYEEVVWKSPASYDDTTVPSSA